MTGVEHSQVPHAQEQAPAPEGIRGSGTGRPAMTFDEVIGLAQVDVPHREPYRTAAVVVVGLALALVPVMALAGYRRLAVLWLAGEVAALALLRLRRVDGSWIAARGRRFDVVFGILLALALVGLSFYANLPRVM